MKQFDVPIVLIVFNRPDFTALVFEKIRCLQPARLFVVADGPRINQPGEIEKCVSARSIIDTIDWPCDVLKKYSEVNLGCKISVSSGIDWVFEQVEEAIVLEDDCIPDSTFFFYCRELLERYRNDERIMMICGTNLSDSTNDLKNSYYFSRYPHIWGWASWKRVWRNYDVRLSLLETMLEDRSFRDSFKTRHEYHHWAKCFMSVSSGEVDTWDAQVTYMAFRTSALSIFPKKNLISNIGFGKDATHTIRRSHLANLPSHPMEFPMKHPYFMFANLSAENERKRKEGVESSKILNIVRFMLRKMGLK